MNPSLVYESVHDTTVADIKSASFDAQPVTFGSIERRFWRESVSETVWSAIAPSVILAGQVDDFFDGIDFCPGFGNDYFRDEATLATVERLEVGKGPLVRFLFGSTFHRVRK